MRTCQDVKSQRPADGGADCRAVGCQPPPLFRLDERAQGGRFGRTAGASARRRGRAPSARRCLQGTAGRPALRPVEVAGQNAAEFLCLPEASLERSGWFLKHLAASDPTAEHLVIGDQAGFHPKPEPHAVPAPVRLVSLPPSSPELHPTEAIGDGIKERMGKVRWQSLDDLEQAMGEALPLCVKRPSRGADWLLTLGSSNQQTLPLPRIVRLQAQSGINQLVPVAASFQRMHNYCAGFVSTSGWRAVQCFLFHIFDFAPGKMFCPRKFCGVLGQV